MKRILLYGLDEETANKARELLLPQNISIHIIGDDVLDEKLSEVIEANSDFDGRHQEFEGDYLIFDGIELKEMVRLIIIMSQAGISLPGVKISRTETNSGWTIRRLFKETLKEHRYTLKLVELRQILMDCNSLDLSSLDSRTQKEFSKAAMEAYVAIKANGRASMDQVDHAYEGLIKCLERIPKLYN